MRVSPSRAAISVLLVAPLLAACSPQQAPPPGSTGSALGCPPSADEVIGDTIRLGSTMPLSGPLASVGTNRIGVEAYIDYINDNGGVGGRRLELTILDDKADPATGVANVQRLISETKIDALVAVTTTPVNLAIAELAAEQCIPNLFALTGDARFTAGQFQGMIPASDPYDTQAVALVTDIVAEAGQGAVVGIIRAENDSGAGLATSLRAAAEAAGVTLLPEQTVSPADAAPPSTQVQALAGQADVVILLLSPFQCPPALQAIARSDWNPLVYSSDFCGYPSILEPAGELANGVRSVNWVVDPTNPDNAGRADVQAYLTAMQGRDAGAALTSFAETGWVSAAGAVALLRQVAESGELTRANIVAATTAISDLDVPLLYPNIGVRTAPGAVSPWDSVYVVEYRDGHFYPVQRVAAS